MEKNRTLYVLAWLIVIGFYILCAFLIYKPIPEGSNEVVFMLFGSIASAFVAVIQYFFGSSKSSSDKTKMLNNKKVDEL